MIKPQEVRDNMFLFINCLIENPAFTSQTKEQLTTKVSQFGGKDKFVANDNLINRILKTSIVEKIRAIANANEDKALQKLMVAENCVSRVKLIWLMQTELVQKTDTIVL